MVKLIIYYGDYTFRNSALDMVSLLKKEIKNEIEKLDINEPEKRSIIQKFIIVGNGNA